MDRDQYTGLVRINRQEMPEVGDLFFVFTSFGEEVCRVLITHEIEPDHYNIENAIRWKLTGLTLWDDRELENVGKINTYKFTTDTNERYFYFMPRYP